MFSGTLHGTRRFTRPGWVWALALGLATNTAPLLAQDRSAGQLTLVEEHIRRPDGRIRVLYSLTLLVDTLPPAPVRVFARPAKQPVRIWPDWPAEPLLDDAAPAPSATAEPKPDARFFKPRTQPSGTGIWPTFWPRP